GKQNNEAPKNDPFSCHTSASVVKLNLRELRSRLVEVWSFPMRAIIGLGVIISYFVIAILASVGAIKIAHDFAGEMGNIVPPPPDGVIIVIPLLAAFSLMGVTAWAINKQIVEDL